MTEHRCGPTPAQASDARLRGEPLGTWPRCDACAAAEADLLDRVELIVLKDRPAPTFDEIKAPER